VHCPFPDWRFKPADSIAAYVFHGFLVVGAPVPVAGAPLDEWIERLRELTVSLSCDGSVVATGGGADVLGSPLLACAHLARVLSECGAEPVRAGEVVTTGTLTNAMPIASGQTWTTAITGLPVPDASIVFYSSSD
jgi:2-oxo-3-hexenedioate decarboxylase